jgi:hypothetical protein
MRIAITALWLGCFAALAAAQHGLEIIPLRHRTVDQVLPVLRPLLEPGATLSGHSNQLFVRASPANVAELKRVLEAIDRPARRLQILVRFDSSLDASAREIGAGGTISNRGSRVEVRAGDSRSRGDERIDQRLQVLEGGRGYIAMGQSTPLRDRATGFEVVPRVSGDIVTVEIAQQRERGSSFQQVSTTASGRLGEWFELGGAATGASRDVRGIASMGNSANSESQRVWLKVEEIRN